MKLKKKVVLCVSVVVMVVSFLCFGIVSFAEDPDEITRKPEVLNVKYLNENYITNYRFGNDVKEIAYNGGMKIDLGNDARIFSENGKIIDQYKDKGLIFTKDKEIVLVENENPKNLNILDETGNVLDDTIYYTTDGKVKSVNVKNNARMEIAPLANYNVEMMYLVNNRELFCLSEGKVIKFNLETMAVEEVDQCSEANMFIPTEYGIIFIGKNNDINTITVKGTNIKSFIDEIQRKQSYINYELYNFDRDNIYLQIVVPETEYEYEKTIRYKASISDLFSKLSVNIFKEDFNTDYDGIYSGNMGKIEISSYAGGYKLGNYINEFFVGGVKLKLNNNIELISKDDKIYICEANNECLLAKEKDVKNMCVINNGDNYLYYTSKNIIKRLNLTTLRKEYVGELKDVKAEKMCSVDDNYLYFISDGNICVYDIKNNKIEVKESADGITNYIPTSFGIIKLVNLGEEIGIIANGSNIRECFDELFVEISYEDFKFYGINNENLYIQIKLPETDLELEKTLRYRISVEQLFNNLNVGAFVEDYNSEYDNLYNNRICTYNKENYVGRYKLGNSQEKFFDGGTVLELDQNNKLESKNNGIYYVDNNGNENLIAKEKNVENMCVIVINNVDYLYYTTSNIVKRMNMSNLRKEFVDNLGEFTVTQMCSVNDNCLYFVNDDEVYTYDIYNNQINKLESIGDCNHFLPSEFGIIKFGDFEEYDFESVVVNGKCISDYFDSLVEISKQSYSVEEYSTDKEYLYIKFSVEEREIQYWISFNDLFNNLSESSFIHIDEDEQYNYLNNEDKIYEEFEIDGNNKFLDYTFGNSINNILNIKEDEEDEEDEEAECNLTDGRCIKVLGDELIYVNKEKNMVLAKKCEGAKNINIMKSNNGREIYYTLDNKIKKLNIEDGKISTVLRTDDYSKKIDMMYLVNNNELWYSVKNIIYKYHFYNDSIEKIFEIDNLLVFIPGDNIISSVKKDEDTKLYDLFIGNTDVISVLKYREEIKRIEGNLGISNFRVRDNYLQFNISNGSCNSAFRIDLDRFDPKYAEDYLYGEKNIENTEDEEDDEELDEEYEEEIEYIWIIKKMDYNFMNYLGLDKLNVYYKDKFYEDIDKKAFDKANFTKGKNKKILLDENKSISVKRNKIEYTFINEYNRKEKFVLYEGKDEKIKIDGISYDYDSNRIVFLEGGYINEIDIYGSINTIYYEDILKKAFRDKINIKLFEKKVILEKEGIEEDDKSEIEDEIKKWEEELNIIENKKMYLDSFYLINNGDALMKFDSYSRIEEQEDDEVKNKKMCIWASYSKREKKFEILEVKDTIDYIIPIYNRNPSDNEYFGLKFIKNNIALELYDICKDESNNNYKDLMGEVIEKIKNDTYRPLVGEINQVAFYKIKYIADHVYLAFKCKTDRNDEGNLCIDLARFDSNNIKYERFYD